MKKLAFICAGLFLILSTAASAVAKDDVATALEHANAAVESGKAGKIPALVDHAKNAQEAALSAAIVAKSKAKNHLDAAANHLQEVIDQGGQHQLGPATKAAEAAVAEIKASKQ